MRAVCAALLVFEAIIVALAMLAAASMGALSGGAAAALGGAFAALCLVASALLRSVVGTVLGSVLQVAAIALGVVMVPMFVLGAIFAVLWCVCVVLERRVVQARMAAASDVAGTAGAEG